MGDALRFVDPADPLLGFLFDGRIAKDFKLSTGTWVSVGPLRMKFLAHFGGLAQDVVFAAPDRDVVTALVFPAVEACRNFCSDVPRDAPVSELAADSGVLREFRLRLVDFANESTGISTCVERLVLLDTPPSIDAHEITDKGTINQKAVLQFRAALVQELYRIAASRRIVDCRAADERRRIAQI